MYLWYINIYFIWLLLNWSASLSPFPIFVQSLRADIFEGGWTEIFCWKKATCPRWSILTFVSPPCDLTMLICFSPILWPGFEFFHLISSVFGTNFSNWSTLWVFFLRVDILNRRGGGGGGGGGRVGAILGFGVFLMVCWFGSRVCERWDWVVMMWKWSLGKLANPREGRRKMVGKRRLGVVGLSSGLWPAAFLQDLKLIAPLVEPVLIMVSSIFFVNVFLWLVLFKFLIIIMYFLDWFVLDLLTF